MHVEHGSPLSTIPALRRDGMEGWRDQWPEGRRHGRIWRRFMDVDVLKLLVHDVECSRAGFAELFFSENPSNKPCGTAGEPSRQEVCRPHFSGGPIFPLFGGFKHRLFGPCKVSVPWGDVRIGEISGALQNRS